MNNFEFEVSAITNKGKSRNQNEDNFFISNIFLSAVMADKGMKISKLITSPFVVGISDGMGGEKSGKAASAIVAENFYDCLCSGIFSDDKEALSEVVKRINIKVCDSVPDSGATLSAVYANHKKITAISVGDSRIYLYKNGKLSQLTTDHTFAQMHIDAGLLTKEQAKTSKLRHILTQYIGIPSRDMIIEPDIFEIDDISSDDAILICSDGFYELIKESEIANILSQSCDTALATELLMDCALKKSAKDNITIMVIRST